MKRPTRPDAAGQPRSGQPSQTPCAACPLKKLEIFRAITPDELTFIQEFKSGEFVADAGATIYAEGSSSPHLYTVLSGWAFRYKMLADGRRQILNFAMPGDFLGLQNSMLNEMQHSVEALTPMVLCVFPREKLWSLYSKHPSLAYDLTWLAARSERLLDDHLLSVGRRTALERVAFVIFEIFRRANELQLVKDRRLVLPLTQQHLGDALGLSLVHTNKTLKCLVERKVLKWKVGSIEVIDEGRLIEIAEIETDTPSLRPII